MFLLDTNAVSEMRRRQPDLAVQTWVDSKPNETQFASAITLTELAFGASSHPDFLQRQAIQRWLDGPLRIWFQDRVLAVTAEIAESAGVLIGLRQRAGKPLALADGLIAATAMKHNFVVATRNTKDFVDLPIDVYDPWQNKLTLGNQRR